MTSSRPQTPRRATFGRRIRAWWPAAAWAAAIFAASSTSGGAPAGPGWDKVAHAAAFALLGVLVARGAGGGTLRDVTWSRAWVSAAITAAYGVSDEWHQAFVPMRSADALDAVADAAGALLGAGAARAWSIYFQSRYARCRTNTSS